MYLTLAIIFLLISPLCESHPSPVRRDVESQFLRNVKYHSYKEIKSLFRNLEQKFPEMARTHTIGKSVKKKDLLAIEIHGNIEKVPPLTPKFKYVANIYGDEALGRQLLLYLAQFLLHNFGKSDRITKLVNTTHIYLMPSINPDGFEDSLGPECDSTESLGKLNHNDVDLNENFPDIPSSSDDTQIIQSETQAMMSWITENKFVLSGNLQGGDVVASYPYINLDPEECQETTPSSDDALFMELAYTYAAQHEAMNSDYYPCDSNTKEGEDEVTEDYEVGLTTEDPEVVTEEETEEETEAELEEETIPPVEETTPREPEEETTAHEPEKVATEEIVEETAAPVEPIADTTAYEPMETTSQNESIENGSLYEPEVGDSTPPIDDSSKEPEVEGSSLYPPGEDSSLYEPEVDASSHGESVKETSPYEPEDGSVHGDDEEMTTFEPIDYSSHVEGEHTFKPVHYNYDNSVEGDYDYRRIGQDYEDTEVGNEKAKLTKVRQKRESEDEEEEEEDDDDLKSRAEEAEDKKDKKKKKSKNDLEEEENEEEEEEEKDDKKKKKKEKEKKKNDKKKKDKKKKDKKKKPEEGENEEEEEEEEKEGEEGKDEKKKKKKEKGKKKKDKKKKPEEGENEEEEKEQEEEEEEEGEEKGDKKKKKKEKGKKKKDKKNKPKKESGEEENEKQKKKKGKEKEKEEEKEKQKEEVSHKKKQKNKKQQKDEKGDMKGKKNKNQKEKTKKKTDKKEHTSGRDVKQKDKKGVYGYKRNGGMPDYNYYAADCFELTFRLSCCKFPQIETLKDEWYANQESLLSFMEAVHWGVKGAVMNDAAEPVTNAQVIILGLDHHITTNDKGEYWRLLLPGKYKITIEADGYKSPKADLIVIKKGITSTKSFILTKASRTGAEEEDEEDHPEKQSVEESGCETFGYHSQLCLCTSFVVSVFVRYLSS